MIAGYIICIVLALIFVIMGYLTHIKKKLWLIAGYQEESFLGDKDKLAKLFGLFSYIVGIATFLLPFGLDFFGIISGIIYAVCICIGTVATLVLKQIMNKPL
ncbi:DUF3784 domain-containing protein [Lysinibacillus sp. KCTC 33748]|uniref:DUF3784 domain-containing protein n=1 Tax=unclassified Lysinibacillus TaxID=2636778 RepID=UPI0009A63ADB|nr:MULTISPECIES: DUF3784 domain-containing protein [unclassified Lysinibacillus]OXS74848.1 DUF3784 domain-containing protein [Lysinibacillus sp. KCTC 33748]SKB58441.1 protein of unknown function [Lysinibacillus sp. AC-3]